MSDVEQRRYPRPWAGANIVKLHVDTDGVVDLGELHRLTDQPSSADMRVLAPVALVISAPDGPMGLPLMQLIEMLWKRSFSASALIF